MGVTRDFSLLSRKRRSPARDRMRRLVLESLENRILLHAACTASAMAPVTATIRGKEVEFDQCYDRDFTHDGTDYIIHVYYTENASNANNIAQCMGVNAEEDDDIDDDPADGIPDRCEHALPNTDDSNGDNTNAVDMADEAQDAWEFYLDRGFDIVSSGTELIVYIAEDPKNGGAPAGGIYVDDEYIDPSENPSDHVLRKRVLAYHEIHHLVQLQLDGTAPDAQWDLYKEGLARAIQDRVDPALDAASTLGVISDAQDNLDKIGQNVFTLKYDNSLWWTWLLDQYRVGDGVDPPVTTANDLGWGALGDFYAETDAQNPDFFSALEDFISDQGSTFQDDFVDFTLAAYAFQYDSDDPRLGFIDAEMNAELAPSTIQSIGPALSISAAGLPAYSAQYWELQPANQCDYTAFTFKSTPVTFPVEPDLVGAPVAWSVMTVDGSGTVERQGTAYTTSWARTVRTTNLERIVGVATAFDYASIALLEHGCVNPGIEIKFPNEAVQAQVGTADDPKPFLVRVTVSDPTYGAVAGLGRDDFTVSIQESGDPGAPTLPAQVITAASVQDDYWLWIQPPGEADGAVTAAEYDLNVSLDATLMDTEQAALRYVDEPKDSIVILDRSLSMDDLGKMEAARTAGLLYTYVLADDDQGGYVAFSSDAVLRESLATMTNTHRTQMLLDLFNESPGGNTSIGDGLQTALDEYNLNQDPDHTCHFVLLSDGMENEPQFWSDVQADVVASGCRVHTVALGPEANELLMQEIAEATGGSYDYATTFGEAPVNSVLAWQGNLSRIYDNIATKVAGRQRSLTQLPDSAAGGPTDGVIDFEDQNLNDSFSAGETLESAGITMQVSMGTLLIQDQSTIGVENEAFFSGTELQFLYQAPLDFLSFEYDQLTLGAFNQLTINGATASFQSFLDLHGQILGGVQISVTPGTTSLRGTLTLDGTINPSSLTLFGVALSIDDVRSSGVDGNYHTIPVDSSADELVVTIAWQTDSGGTHETQLFAPNGVAIPQSFKRVSPYGVHDVWRLPTPTPGDYTLRVRDLPQDYFLTASVDSDYVLNTFIGATLEARTQGVEVPILASFTRAAVHIANATVTAIVTAPNGNRTHLTLHDDGNHGDGQPNDGVYGNSYTATAISDAEPVDPGQAVEGQEPQDVGSYIVNFAAVTGNVRREAQDSFAIARGKDSDNDGMPDNWELEHGLDPERPNRSEDPDMDGLINVCEFEVGTHPNNSDTDGGGESDGSEVGNSCSVNSLNPLDPADDRIEALPMIHAQPAAQRLNGSVLVYNVLSLPRAADVPVDIFRREFDSQGGLLQEWQLIAGSHTADMFNDVSVANGSFYQYKARPIITIRNQPTISGGNSLSSVITASNDPYPPLGSIAINDNDLTTNSTQVSLRLHANDFLLDRHDDELEQLPGTPREDLEMRLSNSPDFTHVPWSRFSHLVAWDLGAANVEATVYVQFRDRAGNVSETYEDSIQVDQPAVIPADTSINAGANNRSGINTIGFGFGQAVTASGPSALRLYNHTTNAVVSTARATITGQGTTYLTWNLSAVGPLPDGRYSAELLASQVSASTGNLAETYAIEFHILKGDMDGNARVNFADYGIVGANFDPLGGTPYRDGDANGDGSINFADYGVVGANFNPLGLAHLSYDFGDAPESGTSFLTLSTNNGAQHVASGPRLGSVIDRESDGVPTITADGDDLAGSPDDEDGVPPLTLQVGTTTNFSLAATVITTAVVNAWIDFNSDGDWDDAGEQIFVDEPVVNGANAKSFLVPGTASVTDVIARFRITEVAGYGHHGFAANGEVEDYMLAIDPPPTSPLPASPLVSGRGLPKSADQHIEVGLPVPKTVASIFASWLVLPANVDFQAPQLDDSNLHDRYFEEITSVGPAKVPAANNVDRNRISPRSRKLMQRALAYVSLERNGPGCDSSVIDLYDEELLEALASDIIEEASDAIVN